MVKMERKVRYPELLISQKVLIAAKFKCFNQKGHSQKHGGRHHFYQNRSWGFQATANLLVLTSSERHLVIEDKIACRTQTSGSVFIILVSFCSALRVEKHILKLKK